MTKNQHDPLARRSLYNYLVAAVLTISGSAIGLFPFVPIADLRSLIAGALVGAGVTLFFQELTEAKSRREMHNTILTLEEKLSSVGADAEALNAFQCNDKALLFGVRLGEVLFLDEFDGQLFVVLGESLSCGDVVRVALGTRELQKRGELKSDDPRANSNKIFTLAFDILKMRFGPAAASSLRLGFNLMTFFCKAMMLEPRALFADRAYGADMQNELRLRGTSEDIAEWISRNYSVCCEGRVSREAIALFVQGCFTILGNSRLLRSKLEYANAVGVLVHQVPDISGESSRLKAFIDDITVAANHQTAYTF